MKDEGTPEFSSEKDARCLRKRTKDFVLKVIGMYSTLPKSVEAQVLGKQVLRSGTSVGASYREACRARSKAELISKVGNVLKELDESSYWFELMAETRISDPGVLRPLQKECDELLAIFTTIAK